MKTLSKSFVFYLLSLFVGFSVNAENRTAKLEWVEIPTVETYEVEVASDAMMRDIVYGKKQISNKVKIDLPPGIYYWRVRGFGKGDVPGAWSDLQGFVVNAEPPRQLRPKNGRHYRKKIKKRGIKFKWQAGIKDTEYFLKIFDKDGEILNRSVIKSHFFWPPPKKGKYKWQVGYKTVGGAEWSKFWTFKVSEQSAVNDTIVVLKKMVEEPFNPGDSAGIASGLDARLSFLLHIGQAFTIHSVEDRDFAISPSDTATASAFGSELRWRLGRKEKDTSLIHGSIDLDIFKQTLSDKDRYTFKVAAPIYFSSGWDNWRAGGQVRLGLRRNLIFYSVEDINSDLKEIREYVLRKSIGLGGIVIRRVGLASYLGVSGLTDYAFNSGYVNVNM